MSQKISAPAGRSAGQRRPGRGSLSRRVVLAAGLDYIDEHGLGDLSMRRLAAELGVEAMSLYKHIANKDDLYAGITELLWEEIAEAAPPSDDWPAWLSSYGRAIRRSLHRHPGTLGLWATQPIAPIPALELFGAQLELTRTGPLSQESVLNALRAVGSFAIGHATTELSWFATLGPRSGDSQAQRVRRVVRALPDDAPDRLIDVALLVCAADPAEPFEATLDLIVQSLTQLPAADAKKDA